MKGVIFVLNCFAVFYSFAFFILRGGELAYLLDTPAYLTSVALGYFTIVKLGRLPLFVFLLVWNLCMIWIFDVHFYNFPTTFPVEELDGKTVVITGANSGTGLATAFKVAEYGGTVYLGCRSKRKCLAAAASINGNNFPGSAIVVDPVLDLSSLDATEKFAKALSSVKIDILLNNAGFAPKNGATQTVDGFEPAVGSMHYGHMYLTKLLLEQRQNPKQKIQVVNVASGTHYACQWFDCFEDFRSRSKMKSEGEFDYYRAKTANVLHALELGKRYAGVSSYSVNLGFVSTNITDLARYGTFRLQRSADVGVRPILYAMTVKAPASLNGFIVDGTFGISQPLSDRNQPLLGSFYLVSKAIVAANGLSHSAREPFTATEVNQASSKLWEISEELLHEAINSK
mmetsp:Transcript_11207/g.12852  ORF Transcript_11207/g.12852 Transcript_11207/m.12852 type:complete len:399 (+) Transcript_11207:220-1416(+)